MSNPKEEMKAQVYGSDEPDVAYVTIPIELDENVQLADGTVLPTSRHVQIHHPYQRRFRVKKFFCALFASFAIIKIIHITVGCGRDRYHDYHHHQYGGSTTSYQDHYGYHHAKMEEYLKAHPEVTKEEVMEFHKKMHMQHGGMHGHYFHGHDYDHDHYAAHAKGEWHPHGGFWHNHKHGKEEHPPHHHSSSSSSDSHDFGPHHGNHGDQSQDAPPHGSHSHSHDHPLPPPFHPHDGPHHGHHSHSHSHSHDGPHSHLHPHNHPLPPHPIPLPHHHSHSKGSPPDFHHDHHHHPHPPMEPPSMEESTKEFDSMEDDVQVDFMMEAEEEEKEQEEEPATITTPTAPLDHFDTLDEATREDLEEIRNGN